MATRKPKVTFGTCCSSKLQYVIVIYYTDNTVKFVTDVIYDPYKECRWEAGKQAYMFDDRKWAEDVCFGLNCNGTGAFVMTVPDYFDAKNFKNPPAAEKEGEEKSDTEEAENA